MSTLASLARSTKLSSTIARNMLAHRCSVGPETPLWCAVVTLGCWQLLAALSAGTQCQCLCDVREGRGRLAGHPVCQQHLCRWPDTASLTWNNQVLFTLHEEPVMPQTRLYVPPWNRWVPKPSWDFLSPPLVPCLKNHWLDGDGYLFSFLSPGWNCWRRGWSS